MKKGYKYGLAGGLLAFAMVGGMIMSNGVNLAVEANAASVDAGFDLADGTMDGGWTSPNFTTGDTSVELNALSSSRVLKLALGGEVSSMSDIVLNGTYSEYLDGWYYVQMEINVILLDALDTQVDALTVSVTSSGSKTLSVATLFSGLSDSDKASVTEINIVGSEAYGEANPWTDEITFDVSTLTFTYEMVPVVAETAVSVATFINDGDVEGQCTTRYSLAKDKVHSLDVSELESFKTSTDTDIASARVRYEAWARHLGDAHPYEVAADYAGSNSIMDTTQAITIIALISVASVSIIGGYMFTKKTKKQ